MTTTLPDLWSDDIKVDVLSPLVILRSQEGYLERKTQGLLQAKVATTRSGDWVQHQLDLIAPALGGYRRSLLTARHNAEMIYPVFVRAECFAPMRPTDVVGASTNPFDMVPSMTKSLE